MRELCYKARELLIEEGNVVSVDAPVTVSEEIVFEQCEQLIWYRYVVTSMANFTILWSYFELGAMYQIRITSSWVCCDTL